MTAGKILKEYGCRNKGCRNKVAGIKTS